MIANPLVWVDGSDKGIRISAAGNYFAVQVNDDPAESACIGCNLGKNDTLNAAKAACEHHHQVAYVRGLAAEARGALRSFAVESRKLIRDPDERAIFVRWLQILDEAERL